MGMVTTDQSPWWVVDFHIRLWVGYLSQQRKTKYNIKAKTHEQNQYSHHPQAMISLLVCSAVTTYAS